MGTRYLATGPVKIVVGFRRAAEPMRSPVCWRPSSRPWGQQVIVENRAGVAGVFAADVVAKSTDGLTLLMGHINSHGIGPALNPKMPQTRETGFLSIGAGGRDAERADLSPERTGEDAEGHRCARKGKARHAVIRLCGQRQRSIWRWSCSRWRQASMCCMCRTRQCPLLTDLMGGQINYSFDTMAAVTPHVKVARCMPWRRHAPALGVPSGSADGLRRAAIRFRGRRGTA